MKKTFIIGLALLSLASCQKEGLETSSSASKEIILSVVDNVDRMDVETKAPGAVTSLSSAYWGASTGTAGTNDVTKYEPSSSTVSSNKITTGKYQTATATAYNWYVANASMTAASSGWTIAATNTSDIVAGVTKANNTSSPTVTLNHIFARTGTVAVSSGNSLTITPTKFTLKSLADTTGTAGTYNIVTGRFASGVTALAATDFTSQASDATKQLWVTPGTYLFTVTYNEEKGDYQKTGLTKSANVKLVGGKVNNIAAKITDTEPSGIVISVSLTAWGSNDINIANGQSGAISWN